MISNRTLPAVVAGLLIAVLLLPATRAASAVLYQPEQDSARIPGQPYFRFFTGDKYERRIVFYLSEEPDEAEPMPLVAYIQGSGAQPLFVADGEAVRGNMGHNTVADGFRGRARLIIVEKPGIDPLAIEPSAAFRQEHTLERWVEAVHAALEAARKLPEVAPGKILVIGHSEGGLVAARLAADLDWITHVALLAGGGPSQLFDLVELSRQGEFFAGISDDPQLRVDYVLEQWDRIRADPDNAERLFFGHSYRRWSSFLVDSPMEALPASDARIYIAQGTADRAVTVASFDALHAHLLAKGADVVADRVAGADHSFALEGQNGWRELIDRIAAWFLK